MKQSNETGQRSLLQRTLAALASRALYGTLGGTGWSWRALLPYEVSLERGPWTSTCHDHDSAPLSLSTGPPHAWMDGGRDGWRIPSRTFQFQSHWHWPACPVRFRSASQITKLHSLSPPHPLARSLARTRQILIFTSQDSIGRTTPHTLLQVLLFCTSTSALPSSN